MPKMRTRQEIEQVMKQSLLQVTIMPSWKLLRYSLQTTVETLKICAQEDPTEEEFNVDGGYQGKTRQADCELERQKEENLQVKLSIIEELKDWWNPEMMPTNLIQNSRSCNSNGMTRNWYRKAK